MLTVRFSFFHQGGHRNISCYIRVVPNLPQASVKSKPANSTWQSPIAHALLSISPCLSSPIACMHPVVICVCGWVSRCRRKTKNRCNGIWNEFVSERKCKMQISRCSCPAREGPLSRHNKTTALLHVRDDRAATQPHQATTATIQRSATVYNRKIVQNRQPNE